MIDFNIINISEIMLISQKFLLFFLLFLFCFKMYIYVVL